jgi:Protein of unknown function (DUF3341)
MSATIQDIKLERDPSIDQSIDVDAPTTVAILAEFDDVTAAAKAAETVKNAGYTRFDLHSPFPIHGIEHYVGIRMTVLPWIVLCCGLTGLSLGAFMTHYTMSQNIPVLSNFSGYPYLISGKPYLSTPAYIPVMFELTILFSAFSAVIGMLILNGLPMHFNPLLRSNRFKRVTDDRFFVVVEASDPKYDEVETSKLLASTKPLALERVED